MAIITHDINNPPVFPCCPTSIVGSFQYIQTNTPPNSFPRNTNFVIFDTLSMTSDINLTTWTPTNLNIGGIVRVRKTDTSGYKILFDDGTISYDFVDSQGDFYTMLWDGTNFHLI